MLEEKIKNLIIEKYGSVRQFALKIDVPYTTIDSILKRGIDNSNVSNVIKMCKALGISVDKSIENNELMSNLNFDNATLIDVDSDIIQIPVLGKIPAGMPLEAIEDTYAIDTIDIPKDWLRGDNHYFALRLEGDSMEPEYLDNDIIIFKQSNTCNSGDDCCIRINGFDATFKRVRIQDTGINVIPLNENNSTGFVSTFFSKEEIINKPVEILGVVKQIRRNK